MKTRKNEYEKEQDMITNILENFDFGKVQRTMEFLDWRWGFNEEPVTEEMLRRSAIIRLEDAMKMAKNGKHSYTTYFSSSGGLKANAWKNRYGHIEAISLEFIVSDWHNDGD